MEDLLIIHEVMHRENLINDEKWTRNDTPWKNEHGTPKWRWMEDELASWWVFLLKLIILGCFGGTTSEGNTHIIQKETQNQVDISFPDLDAVHVWNFKSKHISNWKSPYYVCLGAVFVLDHMRERSYNAKANRAVNQLQPPQAPKRGNQSSQIPCHTPPKFNIDPENDGWKLEDDPFPLGR